MWKELKTMGKLKPCPFCGGEAIRYKSNIFFYGVACKRCDAKISGRATQASAARAWNRRTERSTQSG